MKLKLILITLLVAVFGYVLSNELQSVSASNKKTPTPTPVTSPITSPVTGPVTFAGLKLQGKVTYKTFKRWWNSAKKVLPASDVTVVAKNRETGEKKETQTDANGEYTFILPEDKYRVYVAKDEKGWFVPPFKNVNLKKDKDGVDFQGFKWND